jgi:hypothetical protein
VVAAGIGLVVIIALVAGIVYMQRGAYLALPGQVLKVRTAPLDESSSVAVLDFRVSNTADYGMVVRRVTVTLEEPSGGTVTGQTIPEADAKRVFEALPLLGQKYNDTLLMRERIAPRASIDRMVAARFEFPQARVDGRKRLLIRIEEVDGKVFEISER